MDEARRDAVSALQALMRESQSIERAAMLDDLFGRIHVVVWPKEGAEAAAQGEIGAKLSGAVGAPFWTGDVQVVTPKAGYADKLFYESVWSDGVEAGSKSLRITDRHRSRGGWLTPLTDPLWSGSPPIVSFYSFKGGAGRTTALASFAITRARLGERVAVIDFDLDAPGAGALFAEELVSRDEDGEEVRALAEPQWGVVDYLLERPHGAVDLSDYYQPCRRPTVTGSGEILVFPAGRIDGEYLRKLARVDMEPSPNNAAGLPALLLQIKEDLAPHWILIDCRAGLGEPSGLALSGLAHLHVLFGTGSEQSWQGLGIVIDRLGKERVVKGLAQAGCLLVHAMVPVEQFESSRRDFDSRAERDFRDRYYGEAQDITDERDDILRVGDMDNDDAPHRAIAVSYDPHLAHFKSIDNVADLLATSRDHAALSARIAAQFEVEDLS